jgi:AraC-like DNA-binding protein
MTQIREFGSVPAPSATFGAEGPDRATSPGNEAPNPFEEVSDPERMRDLFQQADFRFLPADRECHAIQQSVRLRRATGYAFSAQSQTLVTGAVGPESVGLLLVVRNPDGARFTGERLREGEVIVAGPRSEYCGTGRGRLSRSLLVSIDEFEARMTAFLGRACPPLDGRRYRLTLDPLESKRLERTLRSPWELRSEWESGRLDPRSILSFEEDFLSDVCTIVARAWGPVVEPPTRRADRYALFAQAAWLLRRPLHQPVRLASVCDSLEVSEETLRKTFQEFTGLSPMRYARLHRMHACREQLKTADPEIEKVKSVALRCGITHLGRFAVEYKQMFGENPSATLRGHSARE